MSETASRPRPLLRTSLLRDRSLATSARVTNVELFFDLVFALAITQLSHHLLHDLSLLGAVQTLVLTMAVWSVWIHASWITNFLDPEQPPVQLLLFLLMVGGLVLSAAIPQAFDAAGLTLAIAIAVMQLGPSLFMIVALRGYDMQNERNFLRITIWFAVAALVWIAGGLLHDTARLILWIAALMIDNLGPAAGFTVPGLGCSQPDQWDVEGSHMAERCAGFVLIAFGESIVVTGSGFAAHLWDGETLAAFAIAFAICIALWWLYFDTGAERGSEWISKSEHPGVIARNAYTYVHLPIVIGIIVAAVADDVLLDEPEVLASAAAQAVLIGGPALYVAANLVFKGAVAQRPPLSHIVGLTLFACLTPLAGLLSVMQLGLAVMAILVVTAAWETIALGRT